MANDLNNLHCSFYVLESYRDSLIVEYDEDKEDRHATERRATGRRCQFELFTMYNNVVGILIWNALSNNVVDIKHSYLSDRSLLFTYYKMTMLYRVSLSTSGYKFIVLLQCVYSTTPMGHNPPPPPPAPKLKAVTIF